MLQGAKYTDPFAYGIVPPTFKDTLVFLGVTREHLVGTVYIGSH